MIKNKNILQSVKDTILLEAEAIANLAERVDESFEEAVMTIFNSRGRVIVTGIGKSAIIGSKIVATLNSTGTPAIFMHAADAIHGDLGNIQDDDVVVCLSKSGNTPEIKVLLPMIRNFGNRIIAITGNKNSYLSEHADHTIDSFVEKEACPNNLAPTTSTTAQLVIGDALAIALLSLNNFSSRDFAKYHPGGTLGRKLYLRVNELAAGNEAPQVQKSTPVKDVIIEISKKRLGATAVVENEVVVGIITDGDIRRMLEKGIDIGTVKAVDIMSKEPVVVTSDTMAVNALDIMQQKDITQILVTENGKYLGVVHFHDLLKEGII